MFTCSKHLYIRIILFFLLLHILWLLITYKQFLSQKNNDKSILINEPYQLQIPQTCYNICQLIIKLPKTNFIHSKFIKPSQRLWPNFNANLMTLYNISYLHLPGGSWLYYSNKYKNINKTFCENIPEYGVVIIIPIKDQFKQLYITLSTLIPILQIQHLCYRIFVIEQIDNELINKGKLKNVGFIEALKLFKFNCVIFHDVNLAPINYYNSYQCDQFTKSMAIHLSVGININKFKLPYKTYIGGVLKISTHHFITVNGYSNEYWGLDIENDDDFEKRLTMTGIKYIHVNDRIGRYLYIPYTSQYSSQSNTLKKLLNRPNKIMNSDGLNDVSYKVISRSDLPFFTHLRVLIRQS
ncbi:unnamed protein product [Schistosoma bovis]|nr:unnamed protein product [Schistosoma bovis]CAH8581059.1 unnamed protein product [Schistosoma bovis]